MDHILLFEASFTDGILQQWVFETNKGKQLSWFKGNLLAGKYYYECSPGVRLEKEIVEHLFRIFEQNRVSRPNLETL